MDIVVRREADVAKINRMITSLGTPGHLSMRIVEDFGYAKVVSISDTSGSILPILKGFIEALSPCRGESEIIIKIPEMMKVDVLTEVLFYMMREEGGLGMQEMRGKEGLFLSVSGSKGCIKRIVQGKFEFPISEQYVSRFCRKLVATQPEGLAIVEKKNEDGQNYMSVEGLKFDVAYGVMV